MHPLSKLGLYEIRHGSGVEECERIGSIRLNRCTHEDTVVFRNEGGAWLTGSTSLEGSEETMEFTPYLSMPPWRRLALADQNSGH